VKKVRRSKWERKKSWGWLSESVKGKLWFIIMILKLGFILMIVCAQSFQHQKMKW
jgi:hypothetical protein